MGATTNLFPAMTLCSGAAGGGVTSDNVSPMNLINIRKVGFGVRQIEDIANCSCVADTAVNSGSSISGEDSAEDSEDMSQFLKKLLKQIL
jgi:tryptophan synthase alpha subunit